MQCVGCSEHELIEVSAEHRLRVAGFAFVAPLPMRRCPRCGLKHLEDAELEKFEHGVARALALSTHINHEALQFMREAIGASRVELAHELKTTDEGIAGWESGQPIPEPMLHGITRLVLHKTDRPSVPQVKMRPLAKTRDSADHSKCA